MNLPHHAHIEPTTYCNLRCENCINDTVAAERRGHLSTALLKEILGMVPFIKDISLLGLGEPLMNPELPNMLEFIKSRGIVCRIATNGMLLDKMDMERLLKSLNQCIISFDAAAKDAFEKIREGSDFSRILKNVKTLVEARNRNKNSTEIFFHTVITKRNLKDVADIPEIAAKLGVDKVRFVMAVQYTQQSAVSGQRSENTEARPQIPAPEILIHDAEIERDLMKILNDRCKRYNIGFGFTTSEKKFSTCWWPNGGIYITYDGFVTPCCLRMDPLAYNFGNIFEDSIDKVFHGEKYQGFRRDFKKGRAPDICANCPI